MNEVRWGMIGCGDVTEVKSGPAFSKIENSKLVAVMSRTETKVRDYAKRHNIPNWYIGADKLINDQAVDAIYIATPPDSHEYYTRLCAEAGKPVYVEKPMARNYSECLEMINVCEKHNVPLFVAYYRRRLPKFLKIKELLDSGTIGDVRTVAVNLYISPRPEDLNKDTLPWRVKPELAGGGYFIDMGSHQLDILDYYFGPVKTATGLKANLSGLYPAEDTVVAVFEFENGILGTGNWCFTVDKSSELDRTIITGSKGSITFSTFDVLPVVVTTEKGTIEYPVTAPEHVHQPLVQTVVDELLGKGKCPSTGKSGARTNWVIDRILL